MKHNQEEIDELEPDGLDFAKDRVAHILNQPAISPASPSDAPPVERKRKPRSDAGKPRAVKPMAAVSAATDAAKRKHLALVDRYYGLIGKREALNQSIDEVVAEMNAQ